MDQNLSYMLVGLVAIVLASIVVTIGIVMRNRRAGGVDGAAIAERLDAIDARLAAVEKTLNDIP
jgi:hypothetical protein